ncbi:MAG: hypothetical protein U0528_09945 [Anaerolineae bacterium]
MIAAADCSPPKKLRRRSRRSRLQVAPPETSTGLASWRRTATRLAGSSGVLSSNRIPLLTPDPYTIFQLTPLIPFEAQRIRFSVAVPAGTQRVEYRLNGDLISKVTADPWWAWWAILPAITR